MERGKIFQDNVLLLMEKRFQTRFKSEVKIPIGNPPKDHRFDCVSDDQKIVIECKCYTWTTNGNNPSAKISTINETILFMSFLNPNVRKIIAIKRSDLAGKQETLAEYYCRINRHLLDGIEVDEIDDAGDIRIIKGT